MVHQDGLLVTLIHLIDRIPLPPIPPQEAGKRKRGRPPVYPDRLFLSF